jgi:SAM-dependent methyltransferase/uncharacterized protein YbaR (Trm112 family)
VPTKTDRLLALLRCPECGDGLRHEPIAQRDVTGDFGLLHCRCRSWPLIDSIPILADRRVGAYEHLIGGEQFAGPTPDELTALVRDGRGRDALLACLAVPVVLPQRLRGLPGLRQASGSAPAADLGGRLRRAQLRRRLAEAAGRDTTQDWIELYFSRWSPLSRDLQAYFLHRYTMPRQLASVALTALLPPTAGPVLDVACGFGHAAHVLAGLGIADWMVGADFNFFPMWVAARTHARRASFVFLDAARPLPFVDAAFGAATCSDAFHLMPDQAALAAEMRRCSAGPLALVRVGNLSAMPNEGRERTAPQYLDLLGRERTRIYGEDELIRCYLERRTPDPSLPTDPTRLAHDKWLSMLSLPAGMPPPAPVRFADWPHGVGRLQLNPMYRPTPLPDGGLQVRIEFPDVWFAVENGGALLYMPQQATVSASALQALREGRRTPEIDDLVARFVLLGLPERYARDPLA